MKLNPAYGEGLAMHRILVLCLVIIALTSCSTWVIKERETSSAFNAWWSQLSPHAKESYNQNESAGRFAFAEWYENLPPDQRAQYHEVDRKREKASLLFKDQMQQGVVQEQLILP